MSIHVRIPSPLRRLTNGESEVEVQGATLREAVAALEQQYPGLNGRICEETGELRRFVNIYVNGEDVRFLQGLETPLKERDEVSIVPAVAGGS
ncbi:MAG: MoaD/ThiS family protein [Chloroflexi bacterium]|nr:MoaD/ThiS family protein [Chloroflexota bacterium]MCL5947177.1 MoaD/ThiS family protein [Chloroflexota bacterium]